MQIFILDPNPYTAANLLCQRDFTRFNKQIVEMAQLIAVAFPELKLLKMCGKPYSIKNHKNHPCVHWVRANRDWSMTFMTALLGYYYGYTGKYHGCESVRKSLRWIGIPPNREPEFVYFSKVGVPGDTVFEKYERLLELKNSEKLPINN